MVVPCDLVGERASSLSTENRGEPYAAFSAAKVGDEGAGDSRRRERW